MTRRGTTTRPGLVTRVRENLLDWVFAARFEAAHVLSPGRIGDYPAGYAAPILLLPGVYETWEFLKPLADRLSARGHPIHAVPGFGYNSNPIPEMSRLAQDYVLEHDLREVIVVAHSKGGLIGKHLMLSDPAGGRMSRMVAINTPFAGSRYASFALRRTLREFAPNGPTLAALATHLDTNSRIVSVFSAEDLIIPGNGELDGAVNIRLPLIGHFRPLGDPLLLQTVVDAIESPDSVRGSARSEP